MLEKGAGRITTEKVGGYDNDDDEVEKAVQLFFNGNGQPQPFQWKFHAVPSQEKNQVPFQPKMEFMIMLSLNDCTLYS